MPKLIVPLMAETARSKFRSFNITLASQAVAARGGPMIGAHRGAVATAPPRPGNVGAYTPGAQGAGGGQQPLPCPPALFRHASNHPKDIEHQKAMSDSYSTFIEQLLKAIADAHDQWRAMVSINGVLINGPTASLGQLVGPPLGGLAAGFSPRQGLNGKADTAAEALMAAVDLQFTSWQKSFRVPGQPWYPTFAALPMPVAPPTPNVPALLQTCAPPGAFLNEPTLKIAMDQKLGGVDLPYKAELAASFAAALAGAFQLWTTSQMITNVLGTGNVPSFAPPASPIGPVVAGVGNGPPGVLSA